MKLAATMLVLLTVGLPAVGSVSAQPQPGEWLEIEGARGAKLRGVVFRPSPAPPYVGVLILHGADGLGEAHLVLAKVLAATGFLTVAACWFGAGFGPGVRGTVACPAAPPRENAWGMLNAVAIAERVRALPGVRRDRLGVVGHSAGANMALLMASSGAPVDAIVSIAGAYQLVVTSHDSTPAAMIQDLRKPVLLFHGEKDPLVPVAWAREYEARARQLDKVVQAHYYPDGGHLLDRDAHEPDVVRRSAAFLRTHLLR